MNRTRGFTLIELLIVIAIIGVLAAIVLVALEESRQKSRDANRIQQLQEFSKAAELYYSDTGMYPDDNTSAATQIPIGQADGFLRSDGGYLAAIPADPQFSDTNGYLYCTSNDRDSFTVFVHTETKGGDYCYYTIGNDTASGGYCENFASIPAVESCAERFR